MAKVKTVANDKALRKLYDAARELAYGAYHGGSHETAKAAIEELHAALLAAGYKPEWSEKPLPPRPSPYGYFVLVAYGTADKITHSADILTSTAIDRLRIEEDRRRKQIEARNAYY